MSVAQLLVEFFRKMVNRFSLKNIDVAQNEYFSFPEVYAVDRSYRPFHVIVWWGKGYQDPIYLITNIELPYETCYWYKR